MKSDLIKIIITSTILLILIVAIILLAIYKIDLGVFKTASLSWISERNSSVSKKGKELAILEKGYDEQDSEIKAAEEEYETEVKRYEAISEETLQIIKDATKEQEYSLEYLWVTLGNYAKAHKLSIAIIEPSGTVGAGNTQKTGTDSQGTSNVTTGTGITAGSDGTVKTKEDEAKDKEKKEENINVTEGLSASTDAATLQVKGDYINLADFVYEVENDKDLRFRLDNISMKSAGGSEIIASFKIKNLAVINNK